MPYDYSTLLSDGSSLLTTWRDIYDDNLSLPENILDILHKTVYLPQKFYRIVASYFLIPSALARVVPYLFLYGQSGSGKSTLAYLASVIHGVAINSSSDTFAAIRNSLSDRKKGLIEIPSNDPKYPSVYKEVELNTCMVWDDIDSSVFTKYPDLYRMFKFGYDKSCDKIIVSSDKTGENLEFRCFCPKIFSSISPLHLNESFKELKRRLIVIPCKRVEELSDERLSELGITRDNWQLKLLDIRAFDWKGFNKLFQDFWDLDMARSYMTIKESLAKSVRGLNSQQRAISLDLMATGITCGIWIDGEDATQDLLDYWQWFKQETEMDMSLTSLLKQFTQQEKRNADLANIEFSLNSIQIKSRIDMWLAQGWLMEKPRLKEVTSAMYDLGFRFTQGKWIKG